MLSRLSTAVLLLIGMGGCTLTREVSVFGGGHGQPILGELNGSLSAGIGEIFVDMPDGEKLTGKVTFFSDSGNRKCRATMVGPSSAKLDCTADVDRSTGHGVGTCVDEKERKYTWHF